MSTRKHIQDTAEAADAAFGDSGNINQIREILFGQHLREQTASISKTQEALDRTARETDSKLRDAEDRLTEVLNSSAAKFDNKITALGKRLEQLVGGAESGTARVAEELDARLTGVERDLKQTIVTQDKAAKKAHDSLRADLNSAVARLEDDKTNRADLGDYLMEIALRLKGEDVLDTLETTLKGVAKSG